MDQRFYLIFGIMFIGYTSIVYNRQSIPYAAPVIAKGENLQNSDLGESYSFIAYEKSTLKRP